MIRKAYIDIVIDGRESTLIVNKVTKGTPKAISVGEMYFTIIKTVSHNPYSTEQQVSCKFPSHVYTKRQPMVCPFCYHVITMGEPHPMIWDMSSTPRPPRVEDVPTELDKAGWQKYHVSEEQELRRMLWYAAHPKPKNEIVTERTNQRIYTEDGRCYYDLVFAIHEEDGLVYGKVWDKISKLLVVEQGDHWCIVRRLYEPRD